MSQGQFHQWSVGNMGGRRCTVCLKACGSTMRLTDYVCIWCNAAIHPLCRLAFNSTCDLGKHKISILPVRVCVCVCVCVCVGIVSVCEYSWLKCGCWVWSWFAYLLIRSFFHPFIHVYSVCCQPTSVTKRRNVSPGLSKWMVLCACIHVWLWMESSTCAYNWPHTQAIVSTDQPCRKHESIDCICESEKWK
jgi:hypothetical protein